MLIACSLVWFYITIIYRVYISFKDNNDYKLSRLELICLSLFVVFQFGFFALVIFFTSDKTEHYVMVVVVLCVDIMLNIAILYVFLKRLYLIILSLDESFDSLIVSMDEVRTSSMISIATRAGDNYDNDYYLTLRQK